MNRFLIPLILSSSAPSINFFRASRQETITLSATVSNTIAMAPLIHALDTPSTRCEISHNPAIAAKNTPMLDIKFFNPSNFNLEALFTTPMSHPSAILIATIAIPKFFKEEESLLATTITIASAPRTIANESK